VSPLEESLHLNLVPSIPEGKLDRVSAFHIPAALPPHMETGVFHAALARLGYELERRYGGVAIPYASGILYVGPEFKEIEGDSSLVLGNPKSISLASEEHQRGLERILNRLLRSHARKLGYVKSGPNFVRATGFVSRASSHGVPLELNRDGFAARISVSRGAPFLSLDLHAALRRPLPLLVEYLLQKGMSEGDIEERLVGRDVLTQPFGLSGIIRGLAWTSVAEYVIEDLGQTVYEYWEGRGEAVDPDEFPVVEVFLKRRGSLAPYPPSQVNLSLKGVSLPSREQLQIDPPDRARGIANHPILQQTLALNGWKLTFDPRLMSIAEFMERGIVASCGLAAPPDLSFGGGNVGKNPKEVLRFGPVDGRATLQGIYVSGSEFPLKPFHRALAGYFQSWGFGELQMMESIECEESRRGFYRGGQEAGRLLSEINPKDALVLGILDGPEGSYASFKRGVSQKIGRTFHAVQMVRRGTALDIVAGKQWLAADLLSQAYVKATRKPAWTLANPAGGSVGTAFLAFDVSRRQEFLYEEQGELRPATSVIRKEASAIASVCDEYGRIVRWDTYPSHSGETLGRDEAWNILTRTVDDVEEVRGDDFRRLVVYKDGPIRDSELAFLRSAAREVVDDFFSEKGRPIQIDFVGVVKSGLERVFKGEDEKFANPERGTFVVMADQTSLICASQPRRGTTKPIRLEYRASVGGDPYPMDALIREFSDLSYLDWRSVYLQPKTPLILQLVQSLGELLTLDIETPTYIPL
jgi:hypothetical protein